MGGQAPLWAVLGATGTGKTALAVALAERVGGEIVGVDSAQIFRGMDIGTAKPSPEERARARHHLVDVAGPDEQWTAAGYADAADRAIAEIRARGRVPILCGGAGLWYRALVRGVFRVPEIPAAIRAEVRAELLERGPAAMHARLAEVDPVAAARLHPNDRQRIGRALEVFRATGTPISALQAEHGFSEPRYAVRAVALDWPRAALVDRLDRRTRQMFEAGLVDEVRELLARGARTDGPGLKCIAYAEVVRHLAGELDLAAALEAAQVATRRYAKRQRNWFQGEPEVRWLAPEGALEAALDALGRPPEGASERPDDGR